MSATPSNFPIEPPPEPPPAEEPQTPPSPESEADESPRLGFWEKMRRRKRRFLAKVVANMVGENPPSHAEGTDATGSPPPTSSGSIRSDIEESGLWSGIANRIRRTADEYLHEKLDEIEHRIDSKLEEIDRRLSEWRDKEIANRLRIMKITLWASVIVAIISLIYAWLKVYFISPR